MGDVNQLLYLKRYLPQVDGPVVEIGSKNHNYAAPFRELYAGAEYVGLDLEPGPGVDLVLDLTAGLGGLAPERFALAICCSVLEHTPQPWRMAEHITQLVRPGGVLYLSVPWVWRYHAYPDDYFRYSPRGVASLFDRFKWVRAAYTTNVPGEMVDLPLDSPAGVDNGLAAFLDTSGGAKRKYLPYLMVNMLGLKQRPPSF